jgi:outer membrane autotransporter protein
MTSTGAHAARVAVLRLGLLSTACLVLASPALADGGAGGSVGQALGGGGGTGFTGTPGSNGQTNGVLGSGGGGGGGGGAGGGQGGNGGYFGGAGGIGGPGVANANEVGGGGGGAGGVHGAAGQSLSNTALIVGGNGFAGGSGENPIPAPLSGGGGGGGGGAGGYGVVVSGPATATNTGAIQGGSGGMGGSSNSQAGSGGDGGIGVFFNAGGGATFTNSGLVTGGSGGSAGVPPIVGIGPATLPGIPGAGGAGVVGANLTVINSGAIVGGLAGDGVTRANAITFTGGTNLLTLLVGSQLTGNVAVTNGGAITLALGGSADSSFDVGQIGPTIQGVSAFQKTGTSTWTLTGNTPSVTPWTISGGTLSISVDGNLGAPVGTLTLAGGTLQATASFSSTRAITLATGGSNTFDTGANSVSWGGAIGGTGGLIKAGSGTLTLTGANTYMGGTTVSAGVLVGNSTSLQGNIVNNATVVFDQLRGGTYAGSMSGTGSVILQGGAALTMTGNNTYSGTTTVNGSTNAPTYLVIQGSLTGKVITNGGTVIGGNGSVGELQINGGTVAPGNSIGMLTVTGNFLHNGGAHQVEVNSAGAADRVNVAGTASLSGATVQVLAAPGSYANRTTYTILSATGGLSGGYTGISDNLAFLTPSLSYDANNAYLSLALQGNAFSGGAVTANQRATGSALDRSYATASGDFATVIGALAGLSTAQGPAALNAISSQPYANFGTTNIANAALFMDALGQQMANARGGSSAGSRVALAQVCEIGTCDDVRPFSAWMSGLAGLGSVQGNTNASTLTYSMGGAAVGIDYRLDPRFLVGLGVGYASGTQWVNSFMGQGWSNAVSLAAYGSFTQAGFYADALAGYAYLGNQLQRQIQVPNLQARTANGSTGANQFLSQIETGYKLGLWQTALTVTPFGRVQFSTTTQNAFAESGAQSLNLNVAQQTTNSLRSVLGADIGSSIPLANQRRLDLALRLGWQHEFANTARPITAAFAGAPGAAFTVYGATPTRDAAIVGLSAATTVADATQIYLRYDGMLGSGTDNHAVTAGLRLSW